MTRSKTWSGVSLENYVVPDSIPIRKDKHRVIIVGLSKTLKTMNIEIAIPDEFKSSRLCQSLITYASGDYFLSLQPATRFSYAKAIKKFFHFINFSESRPHYIDCVNSSDLPYTIIHEFALSFRDVLAVSIRSTVRLIARAAESVAENLIIDYPREASHLKSFTMRSSLPEIKCDNKNRARSLSQIFIDDQLTGEPISCPYLDSEIIKSLREFCVWYLNAMHERRLFLRQVKMRDEKTIYELIVENIRSGIWSFDAAPMVGLRTKEVKSSEYQKALGWSEIYATLYRALTPSNFQLECLSNGVAEKITHDQLFWAEPLVTKQNDRDRLARSLTPYPRENTIEKLRNFIVENRDLRPGKCKKSESLTVPLMLSFISNFKHNTVSPILTLTELILPSPSEARLMSWLLASDCIQISNQTRLKLSDLKLLIDGDASRIINAVEATTESADADGDIFIRHFKKRAKDKSWNTRRYPRQSAIRKVYETWVSTVHDAQPLLSIEWKNRWFPSRTNIISITSPRRREQTHLLCVCLPNSITQEAWLSHPTKEAINKDAIVWLISQEIKQIIHHPRTVNGRKKHGKSAPYLIISTGAIRESRIIFEETQGKTDSERARYDAHSETMASYYRIRGMAKERILMCLKGSAQVADKMIEEAIQFIDKVEFLKLEDVAKIIHGSMPESAEIMDLLEVAADDPKKFSITPFGGVMELDQPRSLKLINDEKTAWMILCYVRHLEEELDRIEANHDDQVIKWIFEHAIYSILFDRFEKPSKELAETRFESYKIAYPPIH